MFQPIEWSLVWFRSKGRSSSLTKEWRAASVRCGVHALPDKPLAGLLMRFLLVGGGCWVLAGLAQACCSQLQVTVWGPASLHMACCYHIALRCPARCFCLQCTKLGGTLSGSTPGTLTHCVRCKASAHGPLWARETRLRTKEKVRSYHLDSILFFLGVPVGFARDISVKDHKVIYKLPPPPPLFQNWK